MRIFASPAVIEIVNFHHFPRPARGRFGSDVALRHGQQFTANHEFLNCEGAQENRQVVNVEKALPIPPWSQRMPMKSPGIRELRFKEAVTTNGDAAEKIRKKIALVEFVKGANMPFSQKSSTRRPWFSFDASHSGRTGL
jgi:hypothetical protein